MHASDVLLIMIPSKLIARVVGGSTYLAPNRARQEFGWKPVHPLIDTTIVDDINETLKSLQLL